MSIHSTRTTTSCTSSTSPTRRPGSFSRTTFRCWTARTRTSRRSTTSAGGPSAKHIKQTPDGFIITEFLPQVGWAGKHNTINCAAGHHLHEGRWLNDPKYLDDYSLFWFRKGGKPRRYSFWAADSIWARSLVTGDDRLAKELLPDLITNYEAWEDDHRDANGLFWQVDDRDGMEVSIGGSDEIGYRATINSYMYGDALAIAEIAERAGQDDVADRFRAKAAEIKRLDAGETLGPGRRSSSRCLPRGENASCPTCANCTVTRPGISTCPTRTNRSPGNSSWTRRVLRAVWPDDGRAAASEIRDLLPGPRVPVERPELAVRHASRSPAWPTCSTTSSRTRSSRSDYFDLLKIYARSQHLKLDDGRVVPWIDENLNPTNGDWIARTRAKSGSALGRGKVGEERGKDYNHSTYCDLVISGLIGLRPRADDTVEVNPLVPGSWDYFCLDQVRYHGRWLTILFDKTGERYHKGQGLRVFADGHEIAAASGLKRLIAPLPKIAIQ